MHLLSNADNNGWGDWGIKTVSGENWVNVMRGHHASIVRDMKLEVECILRLLNLNYSGSILSFLGEGVCECSMQ